MILRYLPAIESDAAKAFSHSFNGPSLAMPAMHVGVAAESSLLSVARSVPLVWRGLFRWTMHEAALRRHDADSWSPYSRQDFSVSLSMLVVRSVSLSMLVVRSVSQ